MSDARHVEEPSEDDWGRNRADDPYEYPLNAEGERTLLIVDGSQHHSDEGYAHREGEEAERCEEYQEGEESSAFTLACATLHPSPTTLGGLRNAGAIPENIALARPYTLTALSPPSLPAPVFFPQRAVLLRAAGVARRIEGHLTAV